ncbi:response regulator [Chitinimonas lacunae]|uniref:Response regulator n=1 Tax=Chitinimonas lacunae TaxID=1963018 RepID=A0ABV8MJZ7_9NEIS
MLGKKKVLLVDDNLQVREVLSEGLRDLGFAVETAYDGVDGLQALERVSPDALVVDFAMPRMNGAELAWRVQQLHPGLPVIMITGFADQAALDELDELVVLHKPFDVETLGEAITAALHTRQFQTQSYSRHA